MAIPFWASTFLLLLIALSSLLPLISSDRYAALSFTEREETITVVEGRTLMKVSLADYGEPSANQGHDPSQSEPGDRGDGDDQGHGGGSGGGRAKGHRGRRRKG